MSKEQKALARTVEVNFTVRSQGQTRDRSPTRSGDSTALSFSSQDVGPIKPLATTTTTTVTSEELSREERTKYVH